MDLLFSFIERQCVKYNIDESHGLKHAKGTLKRAQDILKVLPSVSETEECITLYSAALHDMCDSKYCQDQGASNDILEFLLSIGWNIEDIEVVLKIIKSMSYSKLKNTMEQGKPVFPFHGQWQRAYHVARNADLLEGFIVARCVLYNKQIHPTKTEDEHWQRARELFEKRVFTYVSEGWINLPAALNMVPALEEEAKRCLKGQHMDWPEPLLN